MGRVLWMVFTAMWMSGTAAAQDLTGVHLHLTIDDVPWQQPTHLPFTQSVSSLRDHNQRLVSTLATHNVKASVFVVCNRLRERDGLISLWHQAGHVVGNHTHAHAGASRVGRSEWLDGVSACQETLTARLGKSPEWFRFPYLDHGPDLGAQKVLRAGLRERGLKNSPVTVATSEWFFALHYRKALTAKDAQRQAFLVQEYIPHMLSSVEEAHRLAMEVVGRPVPQTLLIHLNELNIHHLDAVLSALRGAGATFVPLEVAMADEVYSRASLSTDRAGTSWFQRIDPKNVYWFGLEQQRLSKLLGPLK